MPSMERAVQAAAAKLSDDELLSLLPAGFVRELSPVLSAQALLKLVQTLPGAIIKVPAKPNRRNRLAQALSSDEFAALCRYAKGTSIDVPLGRSLEVGLLHREIVRLARQGLSRRRIAERLGMSDRWVREVLRRQRGRKPASNAQRLKHQRAPAST